MSGNENGSENPWARPPSDDATAQDPARPDASPYSAAPPWETTPVAGGNADGPDGFIGADGDAAGAWSEEATRAVPPQPRHTDAGYGGVSADFGPVAPPEAPQSGATRADGGNEPGGYEQPGALPDPGTGVGGFEQPGTPPGTGDPRHAESFEQPGGYAQTSALPGTGHPQHTDGYDQASGYEQPGGHPQHAGGYEQPGDYTQTSALPGTGHPQHTDGYDQASGYEQPGALPGTGAGGFEQSGGPAAPGDPWAAQQGAQHPVGDPAAEQAYPAPAPYPGPAPAKKKRKGLIIGIVAAAVVLLLAGIGIPVAIHANNVAKGDRLAEEFQTALAQHESSWTDEALSTVSAAVVSPALAENETFDLQTASSMNDFAARCEKTNAASAQLDALVASPVPELAADDGADASEKYREAKATSDGLADRRAAAAALANEGAAAMEQLVHFCTVFPEFNSVANAAQTAYVNSFLPLLTIPQGGQITFGGGLYIDCANPIGCAEMGDANVRSQLADAYDSFYKKYYDDFGKLAGEKCFLPEFQSVCDAYASEYPKAGKAAGEATAALRAEGPPSAAGQSAFPQFGQALTASEKATTDAEAAVRSAWQGVDAEVAGDSAPGWQSRSLKRILGEAEKTVSDLVEQAK